MKTTLSLVALVLLAIPAVASSQSTAVMEPGQRIRVVHGGSLYTVGAFTALRGDTLTVLTAIGHRVAAIPLTEVLRVEISRGMRGHSAKGVGLGFGSGALGGLLTTAFANGIARLVGSEWWPREVYLRLAVGSGLTGAAIGGIVGSAARTESWRTVALR